MGDFFPDRLEPAVGVSPLERQHSRQEQGSQARRRAPKPAASSSPVANQADAELEPADLSTEPPHKLDHMA